MTVEEKVKLIHFSPDHGFQHVNILRQEKCRDCKDKPCLQVCPSGVFKQDCCKDNHIQVLYRQCVECGACRLICPLSNIKFTYPRGGFGVMFQEG